MSAGGRVVVDYLARSLLALAVESFLLPLCRVPQRKRHPREERTPRYLSPVRRGLRPSVPLVSTPSSSNLPLPLTANDGSPPAAPRLLQRGLQPVLAAPSARCPGFSCVVHRSRPLAPRWTRVRSKPFSCGLGSCTRSVAVAGESPAGRANWRPTARR